MTTLPDSAQPARNPHMLIEATLILAHPYGVQTQVLEGFDATHTANGLIHFQWKAPWDGKGPQPHHNIREVVYAVATIESCTVEMEYKRTSWYGPAPDSQSTVTIRRKNRPNVVLEGITNTDFDNGMASFITCDSNGRVVHSISYPTASIESIEMIGAPWAPAT